MNIHLKRFVFGILVWGMLGILFLFACIMVLISDEIGNHVDLAPITALIIILLVIGYITYGFGVWWTHDYTPKKSKGEENE